MHCSLKQKHMASSTVAEDQEALYCTVLTSSWSASQPHRPVSEETPWAKLEAHSSMLCTSPLNFELGSRKIQKSTKCGRGKFVAPWMILPKRERKYTVVASLQDGSPGPRCWYPYLCAVPFHTVPGLGRVTKRIWWKWWHFTSKVRLLKKHRDFHLGLSLSLHFLCWVVFSREGQCHVVKTLEHPYGEAHVAMNQGFHPKASHHTTVLMSLLKSRPASCS